MCGPVNGVWEDENNSIDGLEFSWLSRVAGVAVFLVCLGFVVAVAFQGSRGFSQSSFPYTGKRQQRPRRARDRCSPVETHHQTDRDKALCGEQDLCCCSVAGAYPWYVFSVSQPQNDWRCDKNLSHGKKRRVLHRMQEVSAGVVREGEGIFSCGTAISEAAAISATATAADGRHADDATFRLGSRYRAASLTHRNRRRTVVEDRPQSVAQSEDPGLEPSKWDLSWWRIHWIPTIQIRPRFPPRFGLGRCHGQHGWLHHGSAGVRGLKVRLGGEDLLFLWVSLPHSL